jgi:hypothetical protein
MQASAARAAKSDCFTKTLISGFADAPSAVFIVSFGKPVSGQVINPNVYV